MDKNKETSVSGLLGRMIHASVGTYGNYIVSVCGQFVFGLLYSIGLFDIALAGIVLGFVMPGIWVILTYRLALYKSKKGILLPFPAWIIKNPGNTIIIIVDIIFLAAIWAIIITGLYDPVWIKVVFTIILPVLTISMLRSLIVFPFPQDDSLNPNGHKNQES